MRGEVKEYGLNDLLSNIIYCPTDLFTIIQFRLQIHFTRSSNFFISLPLPSLLPSFLFPPFSFLFPPFYFLFPPFSFLLPLSAFLFLTLLPSSFLLSPFRSLPSIFPTFHFQTFQFHVQFYFLLPFSFLPSLSSPLVSLSSVIFHL